jgi:3-oxoadipate enol-lactonase
MTETMVAVDGGEVWADDSGGELPPLVLLHPGVGDSRIWEPILPELTREHRVIRYDARGFGRSPAPTAKFTLLRDLIAVLDHFGLDRVPIVGCSQGGGSALGLAIAQPSRVSGLVLLCPGIPGFERPDSPEIAGAFEVAVPQGVDAVAALFVRLWGAAGETPEVLEHALSAARAGMIAGCELIEVPGLDHFPPLRVPGLVLQQIRDTLRRLPPAGS